MDTAGPGDRGLSHVVGAVLLVGVVVGLGVVATYLVFDLTQEREPAPEVTMDIESEDGEAVHWITLEQGQQLDGEKVRLQGTTDPDSLAGTELQVGERVPVYPTDDEVTVVWTGDHETSYVLRSLDAEQVVPDPDEGCAWVDSETNGGTDDVTIDGDVVDCDVETDKVITVRNGGTVIGDTTSDTKEVDADEAAFYGDVTVEETLNVQDGAIYGSAESETADITVDNSSVTDSLAARKKVEVISGSSVEGDVESENRVVKVLSSNVSGSVSGADVKVDDGSVGGSLAADDGIEVIADSAVDGDVVSDSDLVKVLSSDVSGSVVSDGSVKLDGATIEGEVYVDAADFDCTDSTINGQDCAAYTPEDPATW